MTYSDGRIVFIVPQMEDQSMNYENRRNVAIHEIGHGLGLGHNRGENVMHPFNTRQTWLSENDKIWYDIAYSRYTYSYK